MKPAVWKGLAIALVAVFAAAFFVATFLGPCTHMIDCNGSQTYMKCHWAYRAVSVVTFVGACIALTALLFKGKEARCGVLDAAALQAVATVFLLSDAGIGLCGNAEMTCNVHSIPIYIFMALAIALAVVLRVKADPADADKPKMSL